MPTIKFTFVFSFISILIFFFQPAQRGYRYNKNGVKYLPCVPTEIDAFSPKICGVHKKYIIVIIIATCTGKTMPSTIASDLGNSKLIEKYDLDVLLGISDNLYINFDIDNNLDTITKLKIENSIETFKLKEIYSTNHRDYVKDLIRKVIIYNQSRIDELYSQYGNLFSSREEVWTMVLGNYIDSDDLGKRPLAKLTTDIMQELGIK